MSHPAGTKGVACAGSTRSHEDAVMKITKFTVGRPDSDGDLRLEYEATITNETAHDVRLVKGSTVLVNEHGAGVAGDCNSEIEIRINAGQSASIDLPGAPSWVKEDRVDGNPLKLAVESYITLYRRDFVKLGDVAAPTDPPKPIYLEKEVSIGGTAQVLKIMVACDKPDEDDGSQRVEARGVIRNVSECELEKVVLKMELVDEDDAVIETSEASAEINVGSIGILEPGFWGVAPANLRASSIKFSLSIFSPVATMKATASATAAKD
jgi:hypothetical protein